jgi:nucleotide-binding universal stress UspA family protein
MMTFGSLLLPTDGSDPAEAAARRGFDLAAQIDATVHVFSVADSSIATSATYVGDSSRIREQLRDGAETNVTTVEEDARERDLDVVTAVREGIPSKEIVEYTVENGIDGIVMGTHGRGGFGRMVIGSVADKVVRTSPVPVLTVRPDQIEQEPSADTSEDDE